MGTQPGHLPEHRRTLNVFMLTMLSLAVVVSLRNLPLSAEYGLSSLFYYLVAALVFMIPYALVSAELASGWPKAGGVYVWVYRALGERWGFFAIWMQWFHNMTFYPAMLAFVGAGLAQFFNPDLAQNKFYLLAVILVGFWGITFLNFLGIKTSALISTICIIIGVILPGVVLIGFAIFWLSTGSPLAISFIPSRFIPDFRHISNIVFLSGILLALSGLEVNANLAREVKHPQKSYPRAIFTASLLTIFILMLGSLSITIVIPRQEISLVSGLLDTFHAFFDAYQLNWVVPIIAFFVIAGALGELNAWAIAGVKGLFVTTEHGCLPPFFHKLNQKFVPVNLLMTQAVFVSIAACIFLYMPNINVSYWILSALSAQMYLSMYILLFASGIILRYKKPNVHRSYRVPFGNFGMGIICIVGTIAAFFAIVVSFFPPTRIFYIENIKTYELSLILGSLICFSIPLIIYALKKPHWQLEVLEEIRQEIHRSTH